MSNDLNYQESVTVPKSIEGLWAASKWKLYDTKGKVLEEEVNLENKMKKEFYLLDKNGRFFYNYGIKENDSEDNFFGYWKRNGNSIEFFDQENSLFTEVHILQETNNTLKIKFSQWFSDNVIVLDVYRIE